MTTPMAAFRKQCEEAGKDWAPILRARRKEIELKKLAGAHPDPLRLKVLVEDRAAIDAVHALTALAKESPQLVKRFVRSCGGVSELVLMKSPPAPGGIQLSCDFLSVPPSREISCGTRGT